MTEFPLVDRDDQVVAGHWLLARLGKRVLRPGGAELTRKLLDQAGVRGADVVELAPGLGRTAAEIIDRGPRSYVGVERDNTAAHAVRDVVGSLGDVRIADGGDTGLPDCVADVVVGEAMLSMQGEKVKNAIVTEAARLLRPGGCYAIHELALVPDGLADEVKINVRRQLARAIKVNARPLTVAEWRVLLGNHGLTVQDVTTVPMALLQPRRLIADEGVFGAMRFTKNVVTHHDARRRVLLMRRTFRRYRHELAAVALIARKT